MPARNGGSQNKEADRPRTVPLRRHPSGRLHLATALAPHQRDLRPRAGGPFRFTPAQNRTRRKEHEDRWRTPGLLRRPFLGRPDGSGPCTLCPRVGAQAQGRGWVAQPVLRGPEGRSTGPNGRRDPRGELLAGSRDDREARIRIGQASLARSREGLRAKSQASAACLVLAVPAVPRSEPFSVRRCSNSWSLSSHDESLRTPRSPPRSARLRSSYRCAGVVLRRCSAGECWQLVVAILVAPDGPKTAQRSRFR